MKYCAQNSDEQNGHVHKLTKHWYDLGLGNDDDENPLSMERELLDEVSLPHMNIVKLIHATF